MAKLFLDGIFDKSSNSPSTITISMPKATGTSFAKGGVLLRGLIIGDPTWTAGNKWGPIINDFSNLQDWASLTGNNNQFSWINASTMCWKGTSPLSIAVDFYLINYAKGLNLKNKLSTFTKFAAIAKSENNSDFRVQVHGGFAPEILRGNKSFFTNGSNRDLISSENAMSDLNNEVASMFEGNAIKGALSIKFGHKSKISNLLLVKINVTESTIEVADQNGGNIQPLYYRVSAQFTGVQPLVTTEVDSIFGTSEENVIAGAPVASNGGNATTNLEFRQTPLRPIQ